MLLVTNPLERVHLAEVKRAANRVGDPARQILMFSRQQAPERCAKRLRPIEHWNLKLLGGRMALRFLRGWHRTRTLYNGD